MLSIAVFRKGTVTCDVPVAELGNQLRDRDAVIWIDATHPDAADWTALEQAFGFHDLALEDARKRNQRPKLDEYEDSIFISVRLWTGFQTVTDSISDITDEVDLFFGRNYLVTVHRQTCGPLIEQRDRWLKHPGKATSLAYLVYMVLDTVVDTFFPAIDELNDELDRLETVVYTSENMPHWTDALIIKKRLILLRQVIAPTRDLMNHILRAEQPFIPSNLRIYFQDVYDHTLRQVEQVDLHRDIVSGVMDAMVAQVGNRMNQVMKTLTVFSIVLMTNSLIAGIYGMNFKNMPELHTPYGYFVVLGVMAAVTTGLIWYFRKIKWI